MEEAAVNEVQKEKRDGGAAGIVKIISSQGDGGRFQANFDI